MSLRPRDPNLARVARAGQRMAPGGRRWSEAPIPRVGRRRVRAVGVPAEGPLYWWKFDDASGNSIEDGGSGADIVWTDDPSATDTPIYQVTGIATGSTYAIKLPYAAASGYFSTGSTGYISAPIAPGVDGLIVLDFWIQGMSSDPGASVELVKFRNTGLPPANGEFNLVKTSSSESEALAFKYWSTTLFSVASGSYPTTTAAHIRWQFNPSTGDTSATINGTSAGSATGTTWNSSADWKLELVGSNVDDTVFDEFKIYGTAV